MVWLVPAVCLGATEGAQRERLKTLLSGLADDTSLQDGRVAILIQSLDDGEVVLARDANSLLNAASNVKLFTSAAALMTLGPGYRFSTELLADGAPRAGKVKTLYVRGKGDPSITPERLYGMASALYHLGLREVSGDLVLDESWFDDQRTPRGFKQEGADWAYLAPTGALSLNSNTVGAYLQPPAPGRRPTVTLEPPSDYFTLDASKLRACGASDFVLRSEPDEDTKGDKQKVTVTGCVERSASGPLGWKKIDNPPQFFGHTFLRVLAQRGIRVKGKLRLGTSPADARLLHLAESDTLDVVLKHLNKRSSNFAAEMLLKTMGAEKKGAPGTFQNGLAVVAEFLEKDVGLSPGSYLMENGSGLNDTNRFSAAQVVRLLRYMHGHLGETPEYLSSLGIAGVDGTLKYRFHGTPAKGRLRAKTGTLTGVTALGGYIDTLGGEKYAFSVIVNNYSGQVKQDLDALLAVVAASGAQDALSARGPEQKRDALKAKVGTYMAYARKADRKNARFLRAAYSGERDAAVRAAIAEALYRSNPGDWMNVRALLESVAMGPAAYSELRRVSRELDTEVPAVSTVTELGASGDPEAIAQMIALARSVEGDDEAMADLSSALARVSRSSPQQLVFVLNRTPGSESARQLVLRNLVGSPGSAGGSLWSVLDMASQGRVARRANGERRMEQGFEARRTRQLATGDDEGGGELQSAPAESPFDG